MDGNISHYTDNYDYYNPYYSDYSDYSRYHDYIFFHHFFNFFDYGDYFHYGNSIYNNTNNTFSHHGHFNYNTWSVKNIVDCIIICIGLPLTLMTIYAFYCQVKKDHVAPIYIINLLISDLFQFCCMIVNLAGRRRDKNTNNIFRCLYFYALFTSICFMVCVAMERYLIIAWPMWYRFRRNIRTSVFVCIMVWTFTLVFVTCLYLEADFETRYINFGVFFLVPLPLLIFFLVGTCKALSASTVPSDEKRRIVAILVVVLLIYVLLSLPMIIHYLAKAGRQNHTLKDVADIFLRLNPIADLFLYVFSRKGSVDKFLSSLCCCRVDSNDSSTSAHKEQNVNSIVISVVKREMQTTKDNTDTVFS